METTYTARPTASRRHPRLLPCGLHCVAHVLAAYIAWPVLTANPFIPTTVHIPIRVHQFDVLTDDIITGYGVREYWRFDHTGGRFHDAALAGDVLVDGRYEPVEITHEPDGLVWGHSEVLGLDLCWLEGELRFRDPSTGEFLLTPVEQQAARTDAEAQAEQERSGRLAAEARVEALEAELQRLRGQ